MTPPGGATREVPACALDAERVRAGAEPDTRQVMVGTQRVPYWQGGRAYRPYAAGYFGGFGADRLDVHRVAPRLFNGRAVDGYAAAWRRRDCGDGRAATWRGGIGDGVGDAAAASATCFDGFDF